MAFLKRGMKKKPEPVVEYSEVDQGAAKLPELPPSPIEAVAQQAAKVLENQQTIVANQQVILTAIEATQQLILKLSGEAPEEEPTEEEIQAAIIAARAQKRVNRQ